MHDSLVLPYARLLLIPWMDVYPALGGELGSLPPTRCTEWILREACIVVCYLQSLNPSAECCFHHLFALFYRLDVMYGPCLFGGPGPVLVLWLCAPHEADVQLWLGKLLVGFFFVFVGFRCFVCLVVFPVLALC